MRRQLFVSAAMLAVMTGLTGFAYPVAMTAVGQMFFSHKANGSLISRSGKTIGSTRIAQAFTRPGYFHPRPSAAGAAGYDGMASSGSNKGPTNQEWLDTVARRVSDYRDENGLAAATPVPVDAVTASASGLDPDISIANAAIQAPRVARARGIALDALMRIVDAHVARPTFGLLGESRVNVLELNLALDTGP